MTTSDRGPPIGDSSSSSSSNDVLAHDILALSYGAANIFGLAEVRKLARKGEVSDEILKLPMSARACLRYLQDNREVLRAKIRPREFNMLMENVDKESIVSMIMEQEGTLHHVGDENENSECYYAITSNPVRKSISVNFRGSKTIRDWVQDSKLVAGEVENPLAGERGQPETLKLHYGFLETIPDLVTSIEQTVKKTLSNEGQEPEEETREPRQSKLKEILGKVEALVDEHPDYKVGVSGHSLGGALAVIFAMEAAAYLKTDFPVTCVALGNPRAGNLEFRHVVQTLEERGRLRILCIHNKGDMVPTLPDAMSTACYLCICQRQKTFRHVGMKMKISRHSSKILSISYHARVRESWTNDVVRQARNFCRLLLRVPFVYECFTSKATSARHNYKEYIDIISGLEEELKKLTLETLYKEQQGDRGVGGSMRWKPR